MIFKMSKNKKNIRLSNILKDQSNSNRENAENVRPKSRTKKEKKKKLADDDIDLDEIIKANQQLVKQNEEKKKEKQVENCPHMAIKEDHRFMCTTCRVICCEPCLRTNHQGEQHRWCELMPYEPSDSEAASLDLEDEEPINLNIRGKRRLPGGYVSTRRLGSNRKKDSCTCCHGSHKHDPKSLKRLVPIDSSRFQSDLLAIEPSYNDGNESDDDEENLKSNSTEKNNGETLNNDETLIKSSRKKKKKKKQKQEIESDDAQEVFKFKLPDKEKLKTMLKDKEAIQEGLTLCSEYLNQEDEIKNINAKESQAAIADGDDVDHCGLSHADCKRWQIFREDLDKEGIQYLKENNFDIHSNEPNEIKKMADSRVNVGTGEIDEDTDDSSYYYSDEYGNDRGFTDAVREWIKLPIHWRLTSVSEAWTALSESECSPKGVLYRLAPTERRAFVEQVVCLIEKRELSFFEGNLLEDINETDDVKGTQEFDSEETKALVEKKCEKILSGVSEIKTRFQKIYRKIAIYRGETSVVDLIHTKADKIGEDIIQDVLTYNPNVHGIVPMEDITEEVEAALDFIKASALSLEIPNASILRKVLTIKLDHRLLKKLILKQMAETKNKEDAQKAHQEEKTETKVKSDNEFIDEIKKEQDDSSSQVIIAQVDDLMKMVELGAEIYPFVRKRNIDPYSSKSCPLDIYSICPVSPSLTWMHKVGSENNVLVTVGGKVLRELDFGTSVECLNLSKERDLICTDPLNYRVLKVIKIEHVLPYLTFDKLMPLGICWSREDNILVTLSETYYDYNIPFEKRRLVARVDRTGDFVMEIEYYNPEKTERYFVVPRRLTENKNGDIIVVDKMQRNEGRLQFFNKDGKIVKTFDGHKDIFERPFDPWDVACDYRSRLLVCDYTNNKIIIFQPNYDLFKVIASYEGGLRYPLCMGLDSHSRIWVGGKFEKVMVLSYDKEIDEG